MVIVYFSENYSFVLQDAAQGFHWNIPRNPAPLFAYYLDLGEVYYLSYVVISECMYHDTAAVHFFENLSLPFYKIYCQLDCTPIQYIIYFSDGAASQ